MKHRQHLPVEMGHVSVVHASPSTLMRPTLTTHGAHRTLGPLIQRARTRSSVSRAILRRDVHGFAFTDGKTVDFLEWRQFRVQCTWFESRRVSGTQLCEYPPSWTAARTSTVDFMPNTCTKMVPPFPHSQKWVNPTRHRQHNTHELH